LSKVWSIESLEEQIPIKFGTLSWGLVAYTCNPSYPGSRDQEDRGLKPAWENSKNQSQKKKKITKKGLVEWLEGRTPA
jgi:hypothetical protein